MHLFRFAVIFALTLVAGGAEFPGWQALRVVKSDFGARNLLPLQLAGEAGTALLLVNTRQARFEIFRYTGPTDQILDRAAFEDPNFLPFAEDFEKTNVPLSRLPEQAAVYDLDGDGTDEIFYIHDDPPTLTILRRDGDEWTPLRSWPIADAKLTTTEPILIREGAGGPQVFISFENGIQVIEDLAGETVAWLQPREREIARNRWWFSDLDADGDLDLVEATDSTTTPVRWYEAEGDRFRPAVDLSEDINKTNVARLVRGAKGDRIAFLGANQTNTLSLYGLGEGTEAALGRRNLLPLRQTKLDAWASLEFEGHPAIVELGAEKPVLNLYEQIDGFWTFRKAFPVLNGVVALRALGDADHRILFRVEDEGQLFESRWADGRFTFPAPLGGRLAAASEWKVLGFDQDADSVWWVTRAGDTLVLRLLSPGETAPREIVFPAVSGDYESAVWLGGERLLIKKKFSKAAELCRLVDGTTVISSSRLDASNLPNLLHAADRLYLLEEGVVQELDENLQVVDQIMLSGDETIRSFAPVSANRVYTLAEDGRQLNEMVKDDSGIFQTEHRHRIPFTLTIAVDPLLGLTLINDHYINVPSPGSPQQLVLEAKIDPNEIAPRDREETLLSNLFVLDIDGDGTDEMAAVDYNRRVITVYQESEDTITEVISWKVFEDQKYPYGRGAGPSSNINPYRMLALDLDGDAAQDLVLASHDRLVFYLAHGD